MNKSDLISRQIRKFEIKSCCCDSQVRNIDFIYIINLDRRPERFKHCLKQLEPYSIYPYRFSGVDGWSFGQEAFNDIGFKLQPGMQFDSPVRCRFAPFSQPGELVGPSIYGKSCMFIWASPGLMGASMAHLSVLDDAYKSGYETIWVLEDDITVKENPHHLADYMDQLTQLAPDWDLLYTDDDDCFTQESVGGHLCSANWLRPGRRRGKDSVERTSIGESFFKIKGRTQAHSVVYRKEGIRKIVDHLKEDGFFYPYDTELILVNNLKMYNLRHDIVHGRDRNSSDTARFIL